MKSEDELNEKMVDNGQKDNLDAIKQDDHQDYGDKGDDHAGMKAPEVPPAPEAPGVLPEHADVVLALDLSSSFADAGLLNTVQNPAFLAGLDANLAAGGATDVGYGIASFIDVDDLSPTGFLYHTDQPVTQELGDAQTALSALVPGTGGVSFPEAQLVALQQVGLQAEDAIGYRDDPDVEIEQPDVWTFGFGMVRHPDCPS